MFVEGKTNTCQNYVADFPLPTCEEVKSHCACYYEDRSVCCFCEEDPNGDPV